MIVKYKNRIVVGIMVIFLAGLSLWCWCKDSDTFSDSERRVLAEFPNLSWDGIISGTFMSEFETYTVDQFPVRDGFRSIKSLAVLGIFQQKDNHDLYLEDGYVCKMEYPLNDAMLEHAAERFSYLYDVYLKDKGMNIYFSIVPDKNYFLAKEHGALSLDYKMLIKFMRNKTGYMEFIDISDLLSIEDYYRTDTHWRQERIYDVADRLAGAMGVTLQEEYIEKTVNIPFYGVYYGQLALPLKPDTIQYLTNDMLEGCTVTSYDTGEPVEKAVYDLEKAHGRDAYELFLSGSDALQIIENSEVSNGKELIVFRDSFGSSLVPLLVEGYEKITLVDIRYISSTMLGQFIEFENQDVLFLYSTLILNNSLALK